MTAEPRGPGDEDLEPSPPIGDEELRRRREALERRLAAQRVETPMEKGAANRAGMAGMAQGLKIASEFVAGILVGTGIGYLVDLGFGTSPFGLIVFLLFGFAAGVLNVLRAVGKAPPPPDVPRGRG